MTWQIVTDSSGAYYHGAPTAERDRIQTWGLQPQNPQLNGTWLLEDAGFDPEFAYMQNQHRRNEHGVYMAEDPEHAHDYGKEDVWKIAPEYLDEKSLGTDPYWEGGRISPQAIPPEALSLHKRWEDDLHGWGKTADATTTFNPSAPIDELTGYLTSMGSPTSLLNPNNPLAQGAAPSANKANPKFNPSLPGAFNNPSNPELNPSLPGAATNPANPTYNPSMPGAQNNPSNPQFNSVLPTAVNNPSSQQLNPNYPGSFTNPSSPAHNPDYPNPEAIGQPPTNMPPNASFPPSGAWHSGSVDDTADRGLTNPEVSRERRLGDISKLARSPWGKPVPQNDPEVWNRIMGRKLAWHPIDDNLNLPDVGDEIDGSHVIEVDNLSPHLEDGRALSLDQAQELAGMPVHAAIAHLQKLAGETASQRLRRAQELEAQYGPDASQTVHSFPDGWTIKQLQTYADAQREGHLMGNCFGYDSTEWPHEIWNEHPDMENVANEDDEWDDRKYWELSPHADMHHELPQPMYSLRDPANLPHVSIDPEQDQEQVALGRHNADPKPEHMDRLVQWGGGYPQHQKVWKEIQQEYARPGAYQYDPLKQSKLAAAPDADWRGFDTSELRTADSYTTDTRNFPDPIEPRFPMPPAPVGCTCEEGHKLDCPVHGLDPVEPDMDHAWSVPENNPVGFPQSMPRTWSQAVSSDRGIEHPAKQKNRGHYKSRYVETAVVGDREEHHEQPKNQPVDSSHIWSVSRPRLRRLKRAASSVWRLIETWRILP